VGGKKAGRKLSRAREGPKESEKKGDIRAPFCDGRGRVRRGEKKASGNQVRHRGGVEETNEAIKSGDCTKLYNAS